MQSVRYKFTSVSRRSVSAARGTHNKYVTIFRGRDGKPVSARCKLEPEEALLVNVFMECVPRRVDREGRRRRATDENEPGKNV